MGKNVWIVAMSIAVGLCGVLAVLVAALPRQVGKVVTPVFMLLFVASYVVFLARAFRGKKVILDIEPGRIVLDEGRGGVFPLAGAAVGLWYMPSVRVNMGAVLHLAGSGRALRVGGRDHLLGASPHEQAPPVESVDMYLSGAAFEALLAAMASQSATSPWPVSSAPAPHAAHTAYTAHTAHTPHTAPIRCELLPNRSSLRGVLGVIAPWLGAMALASVVSVAFGSLGTFSMAGQAIAAAVVGVILVAGIVLTMGLSLRRSPALTLEADGRELRLREAKTGRLLAAAALGALMTERGIYRVTARGVSYEYAVLTIRIPGHAEVAFYVHDLRFGWRDAAPRVPAPPYVIGPPDWNALVDRLGARPFVLVRDERWM